MMSIKKQNGEIIPFLKQKDYIMINNALGKGSFGKTVLLKDPFIDEFFVAKKYEPEYDNIKKQFYKNFLDEIKILYKLSHKNIVRIYNYYAYEKSYTGYILMEYINGKNIEEFFNNLPYENATLDDIFIQLIDAFCYIESHDIIHRDIRETNILIDETGTVKIIDFGIGKIFKQVDDNLDSLHSKINRQNLLALPQEYFNGIYTSHTDMFYLGELLKRYIVNSKYDIEFSYYDLLHKMMEIQPENRYNNFAEIRNNIEEYNFKVMEVSDESKAIYQIFTNLIYDSIRHYNENPKFNHNIQKFINKLENTVSLNLYEDYIQNNSDLITSVVNCSFSYYTKKEIPCEIVQSFLEWFKSSPKQSQTLILNNFIIKISNIKVEQPLPKLPF